MVKAAGLPVPFIPEWQRVQWMTPTFRALCTEGVRANGIVFNCLSAITFTYPEPRLMVYRQTDSGLDPLPTHPLLQLLARPNPQMSQAELLQYVALYKAIGGNCYLYKVRSRARRVVELLPLNDSQIVPVAGATLPIDHYNWLNEETGKEEKIPAEDIVHLKWLPDPLAPWRGLAPLVAVAREVDTDNEARRYLFALLKNDAIPRVALTLPVGSKPLSPDEHKRYTEQWQEKYGGDNRGKPAVLGGGMDVKVVGLNLQELAFEALSRVPEARIAGAFRVPPVLAFLNVGLEQMTYNNVAGMRRFFVEDCLVPLWRLDADEIAADLLPEFGDSTDLTVQFDLGNVVALQEATTEKRQWVDGAVSRGYITVNEGRAQLGLPVVGGGDVFLRPLTLQEVPAQLATPGAKALLPARIKASQEDRRKLQLALIAAQRQQRAEVARRMESALDGWFSSLADRVIHRATEQASKARRGQRKAMLDAEMLLEESDSLELENLVKRFYLELIQLSWDTWNLSLGVDVAFDLVDPAVVKALEGAGTRVKEIQQTTLDELRRALQYGAERGWSVDHLVRGDPSADPPVRGLREIIEQTYKGRAVTISRTELGTAQNVAAHQRYRAAGVTKVLVLDNGFDDSAPGCVVLGNGGKGTVVPVEWAEAHPLGHPRCVRAFAPEFDAGVDDALLAQWQTAGGDT